MKCMLKIYHILRDKNLHPLGIHTIIDKLIYCFILIALSEMDRKFAFLPKKVKYNKLKNYSF